MAHGTSLARRNRSVSAPPSCAQILHTERRAPWNACPRWWPAKTLLLAARIREKPQAIERGARGGREGKCQ